MNQKVSVESLLTDINYYILELYGLLKILFSHYDNEQIADAAKRGLDLPRLKAHLKTVNTFHSLIKDK